MKIVKSIVNVYKFLLNFCHVVNKYFYTDNTTKVKLKTIKCEKILFTEN